MGTYNNTITTYELQRLRSPATKLRLTYRTLLALGSEPDSARLSKSILIARGERSMKKLLVSFAVAALIGPAIAHGQAYPSRPITIVVGLPPGVGTDAVGRTIAEHMKTSFGQPVVFENATGAGGTIGTARAARAAPDGYTLSLGNLGTHVVSPATYPNIQYHPLTDFEPVALLGTTAYWLVAKNALPPKDPTELIAWLKANPGKASAGMVGTGGLD